MLLFFAQPACAQNLGAAQAWQGRMPNQLDSLPRGSWVRLPLSTADYSRGMWGQLIWGRRYRAAYGAFVNMPVLDLATYRGGLTPTQKGGGQQTNALRLRDSIGREYMLRSVEKDPRRTIPEQYHADLVLDAVRDQFSASHPLGALAVATLAKAAGIYHTNPELLYLPHQQALAEYDSAFGDAVYLLEERPDDSIWAESAHFGYPHNMVGTTKLLENLHNNAATRIDQTWLVRSRLFDILIGDWDRHDDQWRWALTDLGTELRYRPIPRDRDQAFAHYDGLLVALVRRATPAARQWLPYRYRHNTAVHWANYNAHIFDQTFLTNLSWADWADAATSLQTALTDAALDQAFRTAWPQSFYQRDAPAIIQVLQQRRNHLPKLARAYYLQLARRVEVVGTNGPDSFAISRAANGHTRVQVYALDTPGNLLRYDRSFFPHETRELRCFGLDGSDRFHLIPPPDTLGGRARQASSIGLRLVGGQGADTYPPALRPARQGVWVYDSPDSAPPSSSVPDYNRSASHYHYNFGGAWITAGYNPDDRIFVGLAGRYIHYGFLREPYRSQHQFEMLGSPYTSGWRLAYQGVWRQIGRKLDLLTQLTVESPLYATNFYGLGNQTANQEATLGVTYNRVRRGQYQLLPALAWYPLPGWQVLVGPELTYVAVARNPGRFIETLSDQLPPEIFTGIPYLSGHLRLRYDSVDQARYPTKGWRGNLGLSWTTDLAPTNYRFPALAAEVATYRPLDRRSRVVLASRLGGQYLFGAHFAFYQGASLGGFGPLANLRGYRRGRFTGRAAIYHNIDLRWKCWQSANRFLPFSLGILAGFDHGRVWQPADESRKWHFGYGGGVFIQPFDSVTLLTGAFSAPDSGSTLLWMLGSDFLF